VLVRDPAQKAALAAAAWNQPQVTEAPVTLVFAASLNGWRDTLAQTVDTARTVGAWSDAFAQVVGLQAPLFQANLADRLREYAVKDVMIAATHAALAAQSLGLSTSLMNGWVEDSVKQVIGAGGNDDIAVALLMPLGYAAETPAHPGRLPRRVTVSVDRLGEPYRFRPRGLRSPFEQALGLYHLPRLIDKVRLAVQGHLPGYNYMTFGFDKFLLERLGITPAAFEAAVRREPDDAALLAWVQSVAPPLTDADKAAFNERLSKLGVAHPRARAYFMRTLHEVDPARTDITTSMQLVDLYEGRL
jgi:nitroreductase